MKFKLPNHQIIETEEDLQHFQELHADSRWICFDTEFIGEKRFYTTICLIQIASPHGNFLIDPLKLPHIQPLLDLLANPNVLKIAHAASNDYRLIYNHYGVVAKNTFDTQISSAFLGYKYPVAFDKLLESELKIRIGKGFTVTNWEKRPFDKKQLCYALYDVIYLHDLYEKLKQKLEAKGRYEWAMEECKTLENAEFYETDPYKETLQSDLIKGLRFNERVMLLRLLLWRTAEAQRKNYSKEMVLPGKYISIIVRAAREGIDALKQNRRLPESLIEKYGKLFVEMYGQPVTNEEKEVLSRLPKDDQEDPKHQILMEMLDLLVRYKCLEEGISHTMVLPRQVFKKMKISSDYMDPSLLHGWRCEFLGPEIISWFIHRHELNLTFSKGKFELTMNELRDA